MTSGSLIIREIPVFSTETQKKTDLNNSGDLYELFRNPDLTYHPYVRWWWNGNKVEARELVRELRLLRDAGIGGVEINPVEFPTRYDGDDLGKPSLKWLSDEWIDMLKVVFDEVKALGMTCDLIVGSGWPFGAEYLEGEERAQIAVVAVKKIKGPVDYEISKFEIFREADPAISSPFPGRTMELLSLNLVPDPLTDVKQIVSMNRNLDKEVQKVSVPDGKFALYALVKVSGFMQVINGAPGATGPVLNHYNISFVKQYLNRMSDAIEKRTGPLSENLRALFIDSMELEGSNWTFDMLQEFREKRGYELSQYLPFILFKTGAMGNVTDFKYGVSMSPEIENMIQRMRYDFEMTKAELLEERFIKTYAEWCRRLNVKSRAQAYGRSFFPLESSFFYDIPESESWTMNWLKHKVGEEMPEDDYRRGRAYTMICKYVSSAANLTGKRLVSCEEMTDTYTVFNTSPENLKIGGDQSAITGVTHSVFHGFNYSPPEAPYPGWLRYGGYYNENNTWWPYFHLYNEYKGRLSALLQHVTMCTDIAILPPNDDMWSTIGSQMEPFPSITHVDYFTLVWEAINKNGNGCDYVSQRVIGDAEMKDGTMHYGPKKYNTIFLVQVDSLGTGTAKKLYDFVASGGRVFCVETYPSKSPGWKDFKIRDKEVLTILEKLKSFPDRFILLKKPDKDFIGWYRVIQKKYNIAPYIYIENPDPYVMQNHYKADDGSEIFYIINSHIHEVRRTKITFSADIIRSRQGWIWDPVDGNRYRITPGKDNSLTLDMGPADSFLFIFDKHKKGPGWKPLPSTSPTAETLLNGWNLEFRHCRDKSVKAFNSDLLKDIKDLPEYMNFAGSVIYRNYIVITDPKPSFLNLGKVYGISELKVNGKDCGVKWYGRRIFRVGEHLVRGDNLIEIKVTTTMGNYMKSLTDNPIAQYWTNEKNKIQPLQSMGLIGPVTIY
jgi:alpha-L-rhamnosidase